MKSTLAKFEADHLQIKMLSERIEALESNLVEQETIEVVAIAEDVVKPVAHEIVPVVEELPVIEVEEAVPITIDQVVAEVKAIALTITDEMMVSQLVEMDKQIEEESSENAEVEVVEITSENEEIEEQISAFSEPLEEMTDIKQTSSLKQLFSDHDHEERQTPAIIKEKKPLFEFKSENWVGINLLNRIGALLIIIGAISAANLGILPPIVRTIVLFGFALAVVVTGEFMNRKKPTIASMGVTAAGVALLYVAVAMSHFGLQTLGMYSALIACILATALGVYLAIRYDEQVVGCFALVGGFLPILAIDPINNTLTIGIVIYFLILSMFSLSIALARKWTIMNVVGFTLAVVSSAYLGMLADPFIALLYACFAFFLYIILPLITAYRTKESFTEFDVIFASINAFVSSTIIFLIASQLVTNILGFLSLIFAGIYIGLAHFIRKKFEHKNMEVIFKLTSIAFTILFVPFYFDARWFAIAWLAEAVVIATYGILREKKISEFTGLGLLGFSALSLLAYNLSFNIQFTFNYTFFTLALLIVLGVYIYQKRQHIAHAQVYKMGALINLWIFVMYTVFSYVADLNVAITLAVLLTLSLSTLYVKVKILLDDGIRVLANIMHAGSMIGLWVVTINFDQSWSLILNLMITGLMLAMVLYYKPSDIDRSWLRAYKLIHLINLWLSSVWITGALVHEWIPNLKESYVITFLVILTLIIATLYVKVKVLAIKGSHPLANIMHSSGIIFLWFSTVAYEDNLILMLNLAVSIVMVAMVLRYKVTQIDNEWVRVYKILNLINLWVALVFIGLRLVINWFEDLSTPYLIIIGITLTIILACVYAKAKILADEGTRDLAKVMHFVSIVGVWAINLLYISYTRLSILNLALNLILTILLTILAVYYMIKEENTKPIHGYKTFNLINLWLSSTWILFALVFEFIPTAPVNYLMASASMIVAIVTLLLSALYVKIKVLVDQGTRILANIMHAVALIFLWISGSGFAWENHYLELVFTLILLFVAFAMIIYYKINEADSKWVQHYKNINLINLWLLTLFIIGNLLHNFDGFPIVLILITFVGALSITRIPVILDEQTIIISLVMHGVGLSCLAVFNASVYNEFFIWLFLNFTTQLVALVALNDFINKISKKLVSSGKESPFKLLIIFSYFLFVVTQGLMVQGDVGFNSGLISIIYVIAAFIWIVLGFKFKNIVLRKCGLFLSIAAVAKLLIIDTWGLSTEMRIVSYLTLGVVLMLISFVYQRFSRKLEEMEKTEEV